MMGMEIDLFLSRCVSTFCSMSRSFIIHEPIITKRLERDFISLVCSEVSSQYLCH